MLDIPNAKTLEYIRFMLEYHDSGDGALIWRHGPYEGELAGTPVGPSRQRRVRVKGKSYSCAKIVWFLESGQWPIYRLRHVNLDYTDIRFSNLEETARIDGPGR